ncbi:MAG: GNAT family N-acetyltransferase [Clostridia bacterium]|nr:GNAT family N-acetyltransferase [Clostridia bacterium]
MIVRKSGSREMLGLWGYESAEEASPTARFFCRNIDSGNAVFHALYDGGAIAGELYVFRKLDDTDFADGKTTAYLCAFRVEKEYRGKGYGSLLMNTALAELKKEGFEYAAIGVGMTEEANIKMYKHMGFTTKIKDCYADPCAVDENMMPKPDEGFVLLSKRL